MKTQVVKVQLDLMLFWCGFVVVLLVSFRGSWSWEAKSKRSTKAHEKDEITRNVKAMPKLILKEEVYRVVGAAMDVYFTLGRGFLEPVYQEALGIELGRRGIPFGAQKPLQIEYKGLQLRKEIHH